MGDEDATSNAGVHHGIHQGRLPHCGGVAAGVRSRHRGGSVLPGFPRRTPRLGAHLRSAKRNISHSPRRRKPRRMRRSAGFGRWNLRDEASLRAPGFQGCGLGRRCVEEVVRVARAMGHGSIRFHPCARPSLFTARWVSGRSPLTSKTPSVARCSWSWSWGPPLGLDAPAHVFVDESPDLSCHRLHCSSPGVASTTEGGRRPAAPNRHRALPTADFREASETSQFHEPACEAGRRRPVQVSPKESICWLEAANLLDTGSRRQHFAAGC